MQERGTRLVCFASMTTFISYIVAMAVILTAASTGRCQQDDAASQAMESLNEAFSSDDGKDKESQPRTEMPVISSDEQIMGIHGVTFGMTQSELKEKISNSAICKDIENTNIKCKMKDSSVALYKDLDLLFLFSKKSKILFAVEVATASPDQDSLLKLFNVYKDKLSAKYGPPTEESGFEKMQLAKWDPPALSILSVCNDGEFLISFESTALK